MKVKLPARVARRRVLLLPDVLNSHVPDRKPPLDASFESAGRGVANIFTVCAESSMGGAAAFMRAVRLQRMPAIQANRPRPASPPSEPGPSA
jgi:hypothetical protein